MVDSYRAVMRVRERHVMFRVDCRSLFHLVYTCVGTFGCGCHTKDHERSFQYQATE